MWYTYGESYLEWQYCIDLSYQLCYLSDFVILKEDKFWNWSLD